MYTLAANANVTVEGERKKPLLWVGGSLAHRGKNPHGENIWRVVYSDSINYMFGGRFKDGFIGYRWIPSYNCVHCYVLERWLPPEKYAKCTAEGWDILHRDPITGLNQLGPYPSRGEYFGPCWEFSSGYPTLSAVEAAIDIVLKGENYSYEEKRQAIIKAQEAEDLEILHRNRDAILDALPLDVTRGKLSNRFYSDAADIPEKYSAQDIAAMKNMPLGENKVFTGGAKRI